MGVVSMILISMDDSSLEFQIKYLFTSTYIHKGQSNKIFCVVKCLFILAGAIQCHLWYN